METPNSDSVFGSPPEPIFNEAKHGFNPEMLAEALQYLASQNEAAVEKSEYDETEGCFKAGTPAVYLFQLCKYFSLVPEIQYQAAELFQRFMVSHIKELYTHVKDSRSNSSPIDWNEVETRLKHQIPLRAVSCVQLASKLNSHYNLVSINKAKNFLTRCGYRYATASIVQSEVRVLKTLNYKIYEITPVEYIETLLETLGNNDNTLKVKQLHGVSLKILDMFYICREKIISKLMQRATPDSDPTTLRPALEADLMLLAAAVIGAAGFILDQTLSDYTIQQLSYIISVVPEDILEFSSILIEEVLSD